MPYYKNTRLTMKCWRDDLYIIVAYIVGGMTYEDNYDNPMTKEYLGIVICYHKSRKTISNFIITQIDLVKAL